MVRPPPASPPSPSCSQLTWRLYARRLDTTAALYKSLLGIHNACAVGSPPTDLVFEYGAPNAEPSDVRRMSVQLDVKTGRMTGAKVRRSRALSASSTESAH